MDNSSAKRAVVPTVRIFDIPVSKMNMSQTLDYLTSVIESRSTHRPHQVVTANPIMVMAALESAPYKSVMEQADLIVPDGAGLVWAAGYIGHPVAERVTGFDLMQLLLERGEQKGWKVYLLGASPEVIAAAKSRLMERFRKLEIVGCRDGYFGEDMDAEVIADIRRAEPDLLFVGRSAATQEPWIHRYREELGVPVMMGVGGSFDVISGKLKRAPVWFRRLRLEWFYRLLQEPWRARRMLALPKFVVRIIAAKKSLQKAQQKTLN